MVRGWARATHHNSGLSPTELSIRQSSTELYVQILEMLPFFLHSGFQEVNTIR